MRAPARLPQSDPAASLTRPSHRRILIHTSRQVGKYLVSPLIRRNNGGRYSASVSIRSGRGSMTHDRVMRFEPVFDSHDQAAHFAVAQALAWIGTPALPIAPFTRTQE